MFEIISFKKIFLCHNILEDCSLCGGKNRLLQLLSLRNRSFAEKNCFSIHVILKQFSPVINMPKATKKTAALKANQEPREEQFEDDENLPDSQHSNNGAVVQLFTFHFLLSFQIDLDLPVCTRRKQTCGSGSTLSILQMTVPSGRVRSAATWTKTKMRAASETRCRKCSRSLDVSGGPHPTHLQKRVQISNGIPNF